MGGETPSFDPDDHKKVEGGYVPKTAEENTDVAHKKGLLINEGFDLGKKAKENKTIESKVPSYDLRDVSGALVSVIPRDAETERYLIETHGPDRNKDGSWWFGHAAWAKTKEGLEASLKDSGSIPR